MDSYEKLGSFYLGREVDPSNPEVAARSGDLLYDSSDLTTHAVCVGMTGSGKTGLCLALLEEAGLDGIPAIAIDPKGDLGNLLLTFPDLAPASFEPWVSAEQAEAEGLTVAQLAAREAATWSEGLAEWGQSGERIARLRAAVDMTIYTPGSRAGVPISILGSLASPPPAILDDEDLLQDRVSTTATSLLTLLGVGADPLKSREHVLLSSLLDRCWREGRDLDLAGLIAAIQSPPMERVGVVDLETFYPRADRFELAMRINSLLAAPGFQSWLAGEALDAGRLLFTEAGRPRLAIVSIAHLSESERMFFVSLLLNEVLSWVRTRPGTSSLRAILYMDEIFGFMPPVAEPPSKRPLLTLLKQARAYGLGVVLATQNPVDLDYKGLSNTGTWFLGRLQTERDKLRVLDGLEGVGTGFDRAATERLLSGLGKRVFLLHNVHEERPVLFRTRWAMSYLRGPLTRAQIRSLCGEVRSENASERPTLAEPADLRPTSPGPKPGATAAAVVAAEGAPGMAGGAGGAVAGGPPIVSPDIRQVFLPVDRYSGSLAYQPGILGLARVHYTNRSRSREVTEETALVLPALGGPDDAIAWQEATRVTLDCARLGDEPAGPARFASFGGSPTPETFRRGAKDFSEHLYRTSAYTLLRSPLLDELSEPGESEGDFRIRLGERARERRDAAIADLRARYRRRVESLESRVATAGDRVERERQQATSTRLDTAISLGTTLLSAFLGRKRLSSTTLSRAGSAAKGFGRSSKEAQDVERAETALEGLQASLARLEAELEAEITSLEARYDPTREPLETIELKPRRTDVDVELVALAWLPFEVAEDGSRRWLTRGL